MITTQMIIWAEPWFGQLWELSILTREEFPIFLVSPGQVKGLGAAVLKIQAGILNNQLQKKEMFIHFHTGT